MKRAGRPIQKVLLFFMCFFILHISPNTVCSEELMEDPPSKQIVGWIENIRVFPGNLPIRAKMDTGAKHSSINASRIERFKRDDVEWVRFSVVNKKGTAATFEEKIVRFSKIKEHKGKLQLRPVIRLWFCLGDRMYATEVNLVDRSFLNYQVLVGRSFLHGRFIVDPEKTFTIKPNCRPQEIDVK